MAEIKRIRVAVILTVMLLSFVVSNQAQATTFLTDNTFDIVTVQCFAFAGTAMQNNYGLWWMQSVGLASLIFNAVDVATTEIDCHFVSLTNGAHQWFPVYKSSGLTVNCGGNCGWIIEINGFYLNDPVTDTNVLVYGWLAPPDPWTEPL